MTRELLADQIACEILDKTSKGRINAVQRVLLTLLLRRIGQWVPHDKMQDAIRNEGHGGPPATMTPESARVQVLRALAALESKLREYKEQYYRDREQSFRRRQSGVYEDLTDFYRSQSGLKKDLIDFWIERKRGSGVRLLGGPSNELIEALEREEAQLESTQHEITRDGETEIAFRKIWYAQCPQCAFPVVATNLINRWNFCPRCGVKLPLPKTFKS